MNTTATTISRPHGETVMQILGAVALVHLLNDLTQAMLPSIYPMLKAEFGLSFTQVGLITLTFQCTASLLQPWIGHYTDKHPKPFLLPMGMVATLIGVLMMSFASTFPSLLVSAALIGVGSSTFHPEASRVARAASGGRFGFAQSLFQVGGNAGSALGPVLAAAVIIGRGQGNIAWFALLVLAIMVINRDALDDRQGEWAHQAKGAASAQAAKPEHPMAFLKLPSVWLCFSFFFWSTCALSAIQTFASPAMQSMYGLPLSVTQDEVKFEGHAIECRINAEDSKTFAPSPGRVTDFHQPGGLHVRVDSALYDGYRIPPYYDSLIAKLIVYGDTREQAIARMRTALLETAVEGISTNIPLHAELMVDAKFMAGGTNIHYLEEWLSQHKR